MKKTQKNTPQKGGIFLYFIEIYLGALPLQPAPSTLTVAP